MCISQNSAQQRLLEEVGDQINGPQVDTEDGGTTAQSLLPHKQSLTRSRSCRFFSYAAASASDMFPVAMHRETRGAGQVWAWQCTDVRDALGVAHSATKNTSTNKAGCGKYASALSPGTPGTHYRVHAWSDNTLQKGGRLIMPLRVCWTHLQGTTSQCKTRLETRLERMIRTFPQILPSLMMFFWWRSLSIKGKGDV